MVTPERLTAIHEAGHAVVTYRLTGAADSLTIKPSDGRLGAAFDGWSDSFNVEHMEARVLSCYAGGHAQREADPFTGSDGCSTDDEIAVEILRRFEWVAREADLRARSLALVRGHWAEILAVADELQQCESLDGTEVELIADGAAGDAEAAIGLPRYRRLRDGGRGES